MNSEINTRPLSPERRMTEEEKKMIWIKPESHRDSREEIRICREVRRCWNRPEMKITTVLLEGDAGSGKTELAKSLSADFGLPYTKVTCFADMDKSDVVGAILPVLSEEQQTEFCFDGAEQAALQALYAGDSLAEAAAALGQGSNNGEKEAERQISALVSRLRQFSGTAGAKESLEYRFYPSEIVRAYENGYLLEIQEPSVIRDAAVLMALNSALEPDGSINLPTRVAQRHPDFVAVITTNRGYSGCRPLNEALRDRVQHSEKMDLPSVEIMMERAKAKVGIRDEGLLRPLAETITLLDQTARANAIKGVAGMRSYFFWADAAAAGADLLEELYHKVLYKMTTDPEEVKILEEALENAGLTERLKELWDRDDVKKNGM